MFALYMGAVPDEHVNATVGMLVASVHDRDASKPADLSMPMTNSHLMNDAPVKEIPVINTPGAPAGPPAWGAGAHLDCGIFGTTYLFDVLHKYNQDAAGLAVLNNTAYPSFGYMLKNGATTLWEGWDGDAHTISFEGTSRNHIMFGGGVNRFIAAAVGGLSIDSDIEINNDTDTDTDMPKFGWKRLSVKPAPAAIRALKHGGFSRNTLTGTAASSWQLQQSGLELNVTVPAHAAAHVQVPLLDFKGSFTMEIASDTTQKTVCMAQCDSGASATAVAVAGEQAHVCADIISGVRCIRRLDGESAFAIEVAAGSHTFRAA